MAAFESDDFDQDLAYRLVKDGFVTLFHRDQVLSETLERLGAGGYTIVEMSTAASLSVVDLVDLLATALNFPAYFGRNLDALNDCLRDVAAGSYGWSTDSTGLVLALRGYDAFARRHPRPAWTVLDIVADRCREAALVGHRMLCLVQSDDPELAVEPVGATPVTWNDAEWPRSTRVGGGSTPDQRV